MLCRYKQVSRSTISVENENPGNFMSDNERGIKVVTTTTHKTSLHGDYASINQFSICC